VSLRKQHENQFIFKKTLILTIIEYIAFINTIPSH